MLPMAIIEGVPGVEVTIFTNGCTAREYDDPSGLREVYQCPPLVTKYIECKYNEPFRINLKVTDEQSWDFRNRILYFSVMIDGVWANGQFREQNDMGEVEWKRDISYRIMENPDNPESDVSQELTFSKFIKGDHVTDEQHASEMERIERLGTIEVAVYRTTLVKESIPVGEHPKDFIVSQEAARRGPRSHGVRFTRTQPVVEPMYPGLSAVFRFKFRSWETLIQKGIAPDSSKDAERNIKKEHADDSNKSINRETQLEQSIFLNFQNQEGQASTSHPTHLVAASRRSVPRTSPTSTRRAQSNRIDMAQTTRKPGGSADAASLAVKRTLSKPNSQNKSRKVTLGRSQNGNRDKHRNRSSMRANNSDAILMRERNSLSDLYSSNICLPSIEHDDDNTETEIIETQSARNKNTTKTTSEKIITDSENQDLAQGTGNETTSHKRKAPNSTSIGSISSSNLKRGSQAVAKPSKVQLIDIEYYHRGLQRLQDLRQEFFRVSEDITKEIESSYDRSSIYTPTPPPTTIPPTRATDMSRNLLLPPLPSPSPPWSTINHTSTSEYIESAIAALSDARTAGPDFSTVAVLGTNNSKEATSKEIKLESPF
ncbi:hypothetical protein F4825DRAFT_278974 [Nemania diffusa]|nr:hypothetical protein F4825DRAFT_278974 [Nemania diffusa]